MTQAKCGLDITVHILSKDASLTLKEWLSYSFEHIFITHDLVNTAKFQTSSVNVAEK